MAVRYFKFTIPKNKDGTPVSYSYGWHGTMPHCPNGEVVIDLYDDKAGYGVAHEITKTEKPFTPKEIQLLPDKEKDTELVKVARPAKEIYDAKIAEYDDGGVLSPIDIG